jgi:predicted nuclease with TOPRIM domain
MALLLIPKKSVKAVPQPLLSDFAELIDLVGDLNEQAEPIYKQIAALQEQLKPLSDATKELNAKVEELELDPDETREELGTCYRVEVGKRGVSRSIKDMEKVVELMGEELFLKTAKVNLKDLDAYLTLPQREEVLKTTRTARSSKLVKRA